MVPEVGIAPTFPRLQRGANLPPLLGEMSSSRIGLDAGVAGVAIRNRQPDGSRGCECDSPCGSSVSFELVATPGQQLALKATCGFHSVSFR